MSINTNYGKLTSGKLEYLPIPLRTSEHIYTNPTEEVIYAAGYKDIHIDDRLPERKWYDQVLNYRDEKHLVHGQYSYVKQAPPNKETLTVGKIREKYDMNQEIQMLRIKDSSPEDFEEYNTYVESCIVWAQEQIDDYNNSNLDGE